MADLSTDIAQQAVEPVSVTADGQSTTARGIGELLVAQNALDARLNRNKRRLGLTRKRMVSPGCLDLEGAYIPPFNGGVS